MNLTLLRLDVRDHWPVLAILLVALITGTLLLPAPLGSIATGANLTVLFPLAAIVTGLVVSQMLFGSTDATRAWTLSRGMTRRTVFVTRCVCGLSVILLGSLCIFALIAAGLRQQVQQSSGSMWYPMIRWYELHVVRQYLLTGILTYCVSLFLCCAVHLGGWGATRGGHRSLVIATRFLATLIIALVWQIQLFGYDVTGSLQGYALWLGSCVVLLLAAGAAWAGTEIQQ